MVLASLSQPIQATAVSDGMPRVLIAILTEQDEGLFLAIDMEGRVGWIDMDDANVNLRYNESLGWYDPTTVSADYGEE
jgi:hypothetical protein